MMTVTGCLFCRQLLLFRFLVMRGLDLLLDMTCSNEVWPCGAVSAAKSRPTWRYRAWTCSDSLERHQEPEAAVRGMPHGFLHGIPGGMPGAHRQTSGLVNGDKHGDT